MDVVIPYRPRALWAGAEGLHARLDAHRFSVLVAHRRFGKTLGVINHLIRRALLFGGEMDGQNLTGGGLAVLAPTKTKGRGDGRFGYVAPFRNQAKAIAWDYVKRYTAPVPGVRYNESELTAFLPNGARIRLFGADNAEALRGLYFDGLIIDEVADVGRHVWQEVLRPALADRGGWCVFIGTPKGQDLFFELYMRGVEDMGRGAMKTDDGGRCRGEHGEPARRKVGDSEGTGDGEDVGAGSRCSPLREERWFSVLLRADETGVLADSELEALRGEMSDSQYRREFLCDFTAAADDVLIPLDGVLAAEKRSYRVADIAWAPMVFGLDVARFGSDESVLARRQGPVCFELKRWRQKDNMTLASLVAEEIKKHRPDAVFVDGGRGEGVIDRLRQLGFSVLEVNFGGSPINGRYANKRAEMWGLLAEWVKSGQLPDDARLRMELSLPTYTFDAAGKVKLEAKERIKERMGFSTDGADALALTFAAPVVKRDALGAAGVVMCNTKYDPYG